MRDCSDDGLRCIEQQDATLKSRNLRVSRIARNAAAIPVQCGYPVLQQVVLRLATDRHLTASVVLPSQENPVVCAGGQQQASRPDPRLCPALALLPSPLPLRGCIAGESREIPPPRGFVHWTAHAAIQTPAAHGAASPVNWCNRPLKMTNAVYVLAFRHQKEAGY